MKITYGKLKSLKACANGLKWFKDTFGIDVKIDFNDLLICNNPEWISWLIIKFKSFQTTKNLELYLAMKPSSQDFSWLIGKVKKYQTPENYEILKQMKEIL